MDMMPAHMLYLVGGGVGLLTLLIVVGSLVRARRLNRRLAEQDAVLRTLERDMQAICRGAKGMGDTVAKLEQTLRQLAERQDSLDSREPNSQIYNHAITLAHRGASIEQLIASCGLARNEAELVHLLHRQGQRRGSRRGALRRRSGVSP